MMRTHPLHHHRTLRPAFTLVEMVIVIGVILLLTALTLSVAVTFTRQSEVRATENLMVQLDAVLEEWQLSASRQVSFGRSFSANPAEAEPCPGFIAPEYELEQNAAAGETWASESEAVEAAELISDDFWRIIARSTVWREFIANIDPKSIEVHDDEDEDEPTAYHFLDAWGGLIIVVHPGRKFVERCPDGSTWAEPYERDDDGTIRTPYEERFGVAVNGRVFFVSAGPDGRFGDLSADPESEAYLQTQDNVYSYEVKQP